MVHRDFDYQNFQSKSLICRCKLYKIQVPTYYIIGLIWPIIMFEIFYEKYTYLENKKLLNPKNVFNTKKHV